MASPHGAHPASSASPHASPDGNAGDPLAGDPLAGDEDDDDEDTVMAFFRSKDRLGAAWYGSADGILWLAEIYCWPDDTDVTVALLKLHACPDTILVDKKENDTFQATVRAASRPRVPQRCSYEDLELQRVVTSLYLTS